MATEVRPAAVVAALAAALLTAGLIAAALALAARPPAGVAPLGPDTIIFAFQFAPLFLAGALIAALRPTQPIGRILLAIGLAFGTGAALSSGGRYFYATAPGTGAVLELIGNQLFKLVFVGAAAVLLLFPTGSPPSHRWRWLLAALGATVVLGMAGELVMPGPITDYAVSKPPANPLAVKALAPAATFVVKNGFSVFTILLAGAALSLAIRYRRGNLEQRLQLKWFALASATWAGTAVVDGIYRVALAGGRSWPALPFEVLYLLGATAMATGIAIAILRHRLFDVDVVMVRSISWTALAALITAVYLGVVTGLGTLLATGASSRLVLAVFATALVALAFQPIRARLDHLARRVVYGPRAEPYAHLIALTQRLHAQASDDQPDPVRGMAEALARGTGSMAAAVWVRESSGDAMAATWPEGEALARESATRCVPIRHAGEELGWLAVRRAGDDRLSPTEERLMDGLALEAGLVIKNQRLQRELSDRLAELRASRQRLMVVQDEERRRLERDLHDGAQQDLVALRMKLGLAAAAAREEKSALTPALDELQRELGSALDSLRSLARGVYPPLLEAEGLRAALAARARALPFAVDLACDDRRYPREVEGAVYFCCSEALQNIAKHANATRVRLRVWREPGMLKIEVVDNGRGTTMMQLERGTGLRNIRDRLEALDGCLEVEGAPGHGTTVRGHLHLSERN